MNVVTGAPVLVGVDGSAESLAAVRLAAVTASARNSPLRVVHAFVWPLLGVAVGPRAGGPPDSGLRAQAENLLAQAEAEARKAAPQVSVTAALIDGAAAAVLLRESGQAGLLVLGDRGLGGFSGLVVGSVAVQTAAHASCPVLVVRGTERTEGPVVAGVDGSQTSRLAVGFAFEEASRRGAELVALHAWGGPDTSRRGDPPSAAHDPPALETEAQRVVGESLAGWAERYPDVRVTLEVVHGNPARQLVERSRTAQLVVVGARGRGGFAGLLLGSVSQSLLHHADCPVAVVRATLDGAPH